MHFKVLLFVSLVGLSGCATSEQSVVTEDLPDELIGNAGEIAVPVVFFELSELDQMPKPIHQAAPIHPYRLRKRGISGEVLVEFFVTKEGDVAAATAKESTRPEFEFPAVAAVSLWKFEPGIKNGAPVACQMQIPIGFTVQK
jgi:TonB family protein